MATLEDQILSNKARAVLDDSFIIHDFLEAFCLEDLIKEVTWGTFTIAGKTLCRQGCFQGDRDAQGCVPWLRCPSIEAQEIHNWTPSVVSIRDRIEAQYGYRTNIAKIQLYADGKSIIRPHADKIIDLAEGAPIYNVRFGDTRTFLLTNKETQEKTAVPMPNNSLFILGPITNSKFLHSIPKESNVGASYSIIFRQSVTFAEPQQKRLFGERTKYSTATEALTDPLYDTNMNNLIKCFALENKKVVTLDDYKEVMQ